MTSGPKINCQVTLTIKRHRNVLTFSQRSLIMYNTKDLKALRCFIGVLYLFDAENYFCISLQNCKISVHSFSIIFIEMQDQFDHNLFFFYEF